MPYRQPVLAAIFDMDGLLIDSEPLWYQAEMDVFSSLGVDISRGNQFTDTLGLRIDETVAMWYENTPWDGPSKQEVTDKIVFRVLKLVEEKRPLLPGVENALQLCQRQGIKIGLASASPIHMLEREMEIFNLRHYFDAVSSAENLPYSKPHPQVYIDAAFRLGIDPINCIAVEDSFNGMVASKAARMRSIVVPAEEDMCDPRWSLANFLLRDLTHLTSEHLLF